MHLDIRTPIGLLFTIMGIILFVYGLMTKASAYTKSLGIDVNLWWGMVLVLFGSLMLWFAFATSRASNQQPDS